MDRSSMAYHLAAGGQHSVYDTIQPMSTNMTNDTMQVLSGNHIQLDSPMVQHHNSNYLSNNTLMSNRVTIEQLA